MKWHLSHLAQILLGLAPALLVIGATAPALLPVSLARSVAWVLLLAFLFCMSAVFILAVLLAGMTLERREHRARMELILGRATRNLSKVKP